MPSIRRELLLIALYFVLSLVIVGQNPLLLLNHFIGSETGDNYEMARNIWWFKYALQTGEPLFYQTTLAYPDGMDGSILASVPLQYFPMWFLAFFLPLPVAYNLVVLVWMALNGWSISYLLRDRLQNPQALIPAFIAGLIYMAFPLFQGHLVEGHAGLMLAWSAPLYLLCLLRLLEQTQFSWRYFILTTLFFYLSTTGHILQAIYVLLPLTGTLFLVKLWARDWQALRRILSMGLVASLTLLIALFPAIRTANNETAYSETGGYVRYSADLLAIVSPSFLHPVFDRLLSYPRSVLGTNLGEGMAYLGVIGGLLALVGFFTEKKARLWGLVGLLAWLFSLGSLLKVFDKPVQITLGEYQTHIILPFGWLQNLPAFNLARTPARFNFTVALALALLAGYGMCWLWGKIRPKESRYALALLLSTGILWEYNSFWGMPLRTAEIPEAVYQLRERDDIRAVFDIPYQHLLAAKDALYLQTAHEQALIAGQITRQTPVNPAKLELLQSNLNPSLLQASGVDVVIYHQRRAAEIGLDFSEQLQTQLGEPFYADATIALYNVPEGGDSISPILTSREGSTEHEAFLPFYVPRPMWIDFSATLHADGRTVNLSMNQLVLHQWSVEGNAEVTTPLYLPASGFYNLRLALDPACPTVRDASLACRGLDYQASLSAISEDVLRESFEGGIDLLAGHLRLSDSIEVRLNWQFEAARTANDVRFVHVLDSRGAIVVQEDIPLGDFAAGSQWAELVRFPLEGLAAGVYTVRVGWYDFTTFTNYQAGDSAAFELGTIEIPVGN